LPHAARNAQNTIDAASIAAQEGLLEMYAALFFINTKISAVYFFVNTFLSS